MLADLLVGIEIEEPAVGTVQVGDITVWIRYDDAVMNTVEDLKIEFDLIFKATFSLTIILTKNQEKTPSPASLTKEHFIYLP